MKILSEFPITDFQIEIRPKMTPYGQISWPLRVCLVDPSRSRGNCGNIKSWFQSNIFQAMRAVLTNYCDTKKQNHVIIPHGSCDMTMTLNVKIYVHILYQCLWKGYDLSDLSHHRLGFRPWSINEIQCFWMVLILKYQSPLSYWITCNACSPVCLLTPCDSD